jgi:hypothetical protein
VAWSAHNGFVRAYLIFWLALALIGASLLAGCGTGGNAGQSDATQPPVPAGWKPVSYQGIEIYVPQSWPVEELAAHPCGGGSGPVVLVWPPATGVYYCPVIFPPEGTIVTLGGPKAMDALGPETEQSINGVNVFVSTHDPVTGPKNPAPNNFEGTYFYYLHVRIPDNSAYLDIESPGKTAESAFAQAQKIMSTIHTV